MKKDATVGEFPAVVYFGLVPLWFFPVAYRTVVVWGRGYGYSPTSGDDGEGGIRRAAIAKYFLLQ